MQEQKGAQVQDGAAGERAAEAPQHLRPGERRPSSPPAFGGLEGSGGDPFPEDWRTTVTVCQPHTALKRP